MPVLTTAAGAPLLLAGAYLSVPARGGTSGLALVDMNTQWRNALPVVQRKAGTTSADVPVLYGFAGGPPSVEARVVDANTGAEVRPWAALIDATVASATGAGLLPGVPQGRPYLLQLRDLASGLEAHGAVAWGVGPVFAVMGQSNMAGSFAGDYTRPTAALGYAANDWFEGAQAGGFFDTAGWHGTGLGSQRGPGSTSSVPLPSGRGAEFLYWTTKALRLATGRDVPVGLVPWAFNSHSIEQFLPSGDKWQLLFNSAGAAQGPFGLSSPRNVYAGDLEGVLWHQGEANNGDSEAAYRGKLQQLCQALLDYVAPFGRGPGQLLFAPAVLGNYDPSVGSAMENIRAAAETFAIAARAGALPGQAAPWPGCRVGWTTIDCWRGYKGTGVLPAGDPYHFATQEMIDRSFFRLLQTAIHWLDPAQPSGAGPALAGSATREGLVATLAVAFEAGATLAPRDASQPVTGFYANTAADFSGAAVAVSAAGGGTVTLTFPAGTAFPVYVKHCGGRIGDTAADADGYTASCFPNVTNLLYDDTAYPSHASGADRMPFGLPLRPSVGAIAIA